MCVCASGQAVIGLVGKLHKDSVMMEINVIHHKQELSHPHKHRCLLPPATPVNNPERNRGEFANTVGISTLSILGILDFRQSITNIPGAFI